MPSSTNSEPILKRDVPLSRLTTMRVGGPARIFAEPRTAGELSALTAAFAADGTPWRVIGGGANVVARGAGFDGAVVRLSIDGEFGALSFAGNAVAAGAGVSLQRFLRECAERGLSGVEGLAGIPGSVGGALVMNAGGRWGSIGDVVTRVRVMDPSGATGIVSGADAGFAYRASALRGVVVLSAEFALAPGGREEIEARQRDCLAQKRATQDLGSPSAGCIFKNPAPGVSAGAIIDKAGLKGARIGGAAVSAVHANFIINVGGATGDDVAALIDLVKTRVLASSGVELALEVELW